MKQTRQELTVSWSRVEFEASPHSFNKEILSRMGEMNDGSSPRYCCAFTFLVYIQEQGY